MRIQTKTLSVRVKDKHAAVLRQMAFEVNQVFNLANEITRAAYSNAGAFGPQVPRWLSAFDVQKLTAGIQKARGYTIGSATVQEVIAGHGKARKQFKRSRLRWRVSGGARRSLGWVPFKSRAAQWQNGCVKFAGHYFKVWDSYGLSGYTFRAGSFSEDSRGRWYFNVCVQVETAPTAGTTAVGVDLGLKDYATPSEGEKLEAGRFYRDLEPALGKAQQAGKKARVRAIHAKIKNRRKDALHKYSTALVNRHAAIFVGDVSSSQLAKTKMVKSVLDAGWAMLKTQLEYKAIARSVVFEVVNERYSTQACSCCGAISANSPKGRMVKSVLDAGWAMLKTQLEYKAIARSVVFEVVNERYSTQACSCCGAISANSPKGRAGLRIREWTCCECGTTHDRDVNAAKNILAAGHCRLAAGIPAL